MVKVTCEQCRKIFSKSPSKVNPRNYCSMSCYKETLVKELLQRGDSSRYKTGHNMNPKSHYKMLADLLSDEKHPAWKGQEVSYRGLHQWIRRKKGNPTKCIHCGIESTKPKVIQWANVDGKYRRSLDDFISLCASCHKIYDLNLKSNRDFLTAI